MAVDDWRSRYHGELSVVITRWVEDYQPGIVEISLIDRFGHDWRLTEKLPVVTGADLNARGSYPQPGHIACRILAKSADADGRAVATIEVDFAGDQPDTFEVFADRIELFASNGDS